MCEERGMVPMRDMLSVHAFFARLNLMQDRKKVPKRISLCPRLQWRSMLGHTLRPKGEISGPSSCFYNERSPDIEGFKKGKHTHRFHSLMSTQSALSARRPTAPPERSISLCPTMTDEVKHLPWSTEELTQSMIKIGRVRCGMTPR